METVLQNSDTLQNNPLQGAASAPSDGSSPANQPKKTNAKLVLLAVMGAIILVLLLLALVVPKKQNRPQVQIRPTPVPQDVVVPSEIPTQFPKAILPYQSELDAIERQINTSVEFLPPKIDPNIGQ